MPRLSKPAIIALTTGAIMAVSSAFAAGHIDPAVAGAIKARQAHMQLYAHNLGTIGAMAQGQTPYDAEAASAAASNLAALSKLSQATYWPQGSDNASAEGTIALPALWENFPDVFAKATALVEAATAMEAAAGTDLASLQAAIGPLGGACSACHRSYRERQN